MISYGVIVGGDGCIADLVFFICYPNLEWWQFQCLLHDCVPWPAKFLHHARWYDRDCAGASWLEFSILTSVLTREKPLLWLSLLCFRVQTEIREGQLILQLSFRWKLSPQKIFRKYLHIYSKGIPKVWTPTLGNSNEKRCRVMHRNCTHFCKY